jgi:hypothetical protein
MNLSECIAQLKNHQVLFENFLAVASIAQRQWRPEPESWSMHGVICHLLDEERRDFRSRIQHLLAGNAGIWQAVEPQDWPLLHRYAEWDFAETLQAFLQERADSIAWLESLGQVDWQATYNFPPLDGIRAGDILVSWVAHDILHLRQLVELKFSFWENHTDDFECGYAGDW